MSVADRFAFTIANHMTALAKSVASPMPKNIVLRSALVGHVIVPTETQLGNITMNIRKSASRTEMIVRNHPLPSLRVHRAPIIKTAQTMTGGQVR
jgi:hypothetical protein